MTLWAPPRPYAEARADLRDLDVIAWEGRGLVSRLIRLITGGSVTHVGLVVRAHGCVLVVESREWRGGRAVLLSSQIPADGVLVLRLREPIDAHARAEAVEYALGATGAGYSYRGVLRFLRRLGIPLRAPAPDRRDRGAQFCSELVSAVLRLADRDPRPDLADAATSPADLVASPRLGLMWRMLPT